MAHVRNQSVSTGGRPRAPSSFIGAHPRAPSISVGGHARTQSISTGGAPHSVSLKVLRLSKPSLSVSHPIPGDSILAKASLPYPSAPNDAFPLSPLLGLPPAFGLAYVGTTFACTLCANDETSASSSTVTVRDIQLSAELQTPGGTTALTLDGPSSASEAASAAVDRPSEAATVQRIVRHDLREDGPHVLAVTVTYEEARGGAADAAPAARRTFRKLYQFVAQPAIGVRTKMGELAVSGGGGGGGKRRKFALEAQLENLTESTVVLEAAAVNVANGLGSTSLNWDLADGASGFEEKPILSPQDVMQVAFVLDQEDGAELEEKNGRVVLAQLVVQWSGPMGEKGDITTGWLGCRSR